jgi:hypothetical protein
MPHLTEHDRCELARRYHQALTLQERRNLAAAHRLTLKQLALLAR